VCILSIRCMRARSAVGTGQLVHRAARDADDLCLLGDAQLVTTVGLHSPKPIVLDRDYGWLRKSDRL
jgi:hypothetical protein